MQLATFLGMNNKNFLHKQFGKFLFAISILVCCCYSPAKTQATKHRISVLSPIYIDSAFKNNTYKIWGNYLPKIMLPGLEFYNGVSMAIDSLKNDGTSNLFVDIYDYRSKNNSITDIIEDSANKLSESKVIIASFSNRSDIKILADYAKKQQIPLISATYPNDGGISNNPYFFLLNPTLRTHCKAIYQHLQKRSNSSNLVYLSRKGNFEDMVKGLFTEFDAYYTQTALGIKSIDLTDSFSINQLSNKLDSTRENIIFCGSINETFALSIIENLAMLKKYKTTVIGMPTWDAIKGLDKSDYAGVDVVYTSAYNFVKCPKQIAFLNLKYKNKYNSKPSDLVYKGYETMVRFGKTISLYGENAIQLFSDDMFKVLNSIDMQAVYNKDITSQIDYFENTKIYFIKKLDSSKKVNE